MSNNSICLFASEIAIITGQNKYQKITDLLLKLWLRFNPTDYNQTIETLSKKHKVEFIPKEDDKQILNRISKKNNIDISKEISNSLKTSNVENLNKTKNEILKKFKECNKKDKEEIKKSLENYVNTNFGTRSENSSIKTYEKENNCKVLLDNKFYKKTIFNYENTCWYLGGRIDGYLEDGTIVEVKNRIYRLFYKLRDYEKVQILAYMFIFNSPKGILIENCKKTKDNSINTISVDFDKEYFDIIINKLKNFSIFFNNFMTNVDFKTVLLFGETEVLDQFELYIKKCI